MPAALMPEEINASNRPSNGGVNFVTQAVGSPGKTSFTPVNSSNAHPEAAAMLLPLIETAPSVSAIKPMIAAPVLGDAVHLPSNFWA